MKNEIIKLENQLFEAMKNGDVATLDKLISNDLQFVTLGGTVLSKEDDLSAHRTGIIKIQKIEPSEQVIKMFGDVATVTVLVELAGSYGDQQITGRFRFNRTWFKQNNSWEIITGSLSTI